MCFSLTPPTGRHRKARRSKRCVHLPPLVGRGEPLDELAAEIARQVLQSEGLRGDYRLNTLRHQGVSARLRVAGGDWAKVLLKNLSVSGAAVLLSPQAEGALTGHEEVELELGLDGEWSAVLRTRILQRRLEGPRVSCGMLFDWPSMPGSAETERELRAWLQREQLRTRARRSA